MQAAAAAKAQKLAAASAAAAGAGGGATAAPPSPQAPEYSFPSASLSASSYGDLLGASPVPRDPRPGRVSPFTPGQRRPFSPLSGFSVMS